MEIVLQYFVRGLVLNADEFQELFKMLFGDSMKNIGCAV